MKITKMIMNHDQAEDEMIIVVRTMIKMIFMLNFTMKITTMVMNMIKLKTADHHDSWS